MRLKSFHGKTIAEAMQKIKQMLGEEAIIISTEKEKDGSVYVTAAIEPPIAPKKIALTQTPHFLEQLEEILIQHHTPFNTISDLLDPKKITPEAKLFSSFESILKKSIRFKTLENKNLGKTKTYVFIGPPGVGKTLSIAKYASQLYLQKISTALITTDIIRAGGVEQLASFAKILNLPLTSVEDPYALVAAQKLYQDRAIILIDTQGVNPFNDVEKNELIALLKPLKNPHLILTLPASGNPIDSEDYINEFKEIPLAALLFTRLDLTKRLGNLIHMTSHAKLPLIGYSDSSNVTKNITPLNASNYAKLILPKQYHLQRSSTHSDKKYLLKPEPFIPSKIISRQQVTLKSVPAKKENTSQEIHPSRALNFKGLAL